MKTRSTSYIFTLDPTCPVSMQELAAVRRTVQALNASCAEEIGSGSKRRYRVSLRGRLGRNNPNAIKYRQKAAEVRSRTTFVEGAHPYQMIKLADAQMIDVYIHRC